MILLVTSCSRGPECAAELQRTACEQVKLLASAKSCSELLSGALPALLRINAVVMDEAFAESSQKVADELLDALPRAATILVNFGISGIHRVVREARMALKRQQHLELQATRTARESLHEEVKSSLTGILLSSQLALELPALPALALARLRDVQQCALQLKERLDPEIQPVSPTQPRAQLARK